MNIRQRFKRLKKIFPLPPPVCGNKINIVVAEITLESISGVIALKSVSVLVIFAWEIKAIIDGKTTGEAADNNVPGNGFVT